MGTQSTPLLMLDSEEKNAFHDSIAQLPTNYVQLPIPPKKSAPTGLGR